MNARRSILFLVAIVLPCLFVIQPARAGTVRVPSETSTITAAITSSVDGDTILVAPGTYTGTGFHDLDFGGKNLFLISESGSEVTILDGSNTYRIFIAQSGERRTTTIRGFTFLNGQRLESWGLTGMVLITAGAGVNFEDIIFEGGLATNGPAVHVKGAGANFTNCIFRNNHATYRGTLYLEQGSSTLENCLFENNTADTNVGAAIMLSRGNATANNCTFQNNVGGTIMAYWNSSIDLNDCIIRDTTGGTAVVSFMENASSTDMVNCLVNNNTATGLNAQGGMLLSSGGNFSLLNCTFANNTLGGGASSVLTDTWDASTITNTVIWGTIGGAAITSCGTVSCSLIFDNDGGDTSACFDLAANGNQSRDPGFCDPDNADYRIAANSPCLAENSGSCGLIGATLNGGCLLVATEASSFGSIKAMYR